MKFVITMKTPDVVDSTSVYVATSYTENDEKIVDEDQIDEIRELCSKWFKYGESVQIEIDTELETATVLER